MGDETDDVILGRDERLRAIAFKDVNPPPFTIGYRKFIEVRLRHYSAIRILPSRNVYRSNAVRVFGKCATNDHRLKVHFTATANCRLREASCLVLDTTE